MAAYHHRGYCCCRGCCGVRHCCRCRGGCCCCVCRGCHQSAAIAAAVGGRVAVCRRCGRCRCYRWCRCRCCLCSCRGRCCCCECCGCCSNLGWCCRRCCCCGIVLPHAAARGGQECFAHLLLLFPEGDRAAGTASAARRLPQLLLTQRQFLLAQVLRLPPQHLVLQQMQPPRALR